MKTPSHRNMQYIVIRHRGSIAVPNNPLCRHRYPSDYRKGCLHLDDGVEKSWRLRLAITDICRMRNSCGLGFHW